MKTIDLAKERRTLGEVLALAKSETILIHAASGEDFVLEPADEFDREAAILGASERLLSFLEDRSKEDDDIPLEEIRRKRGM